MAVAHALLGAPAEAGPVALTADAAGAGAAAAPSDSPAGEQVSTPSGLSGPLPRTAWPVPDVEKILYLHGPSRIDEEVLAHAGLPRRRLDAAPIRGTAPHKLIAHFLRLAQATAQASMAMASFRPHVVLATGGYVSAPAMLAAALRRVPVVLYLPDTSPGLAIRIFAPLASKIALSFALSKRHFRGAKAVVTGYPVRGEFLRADRAAARKTFDLSDDLPVVLVMGGSTGAHSLNLAVIDALEPILHHAQLIHLCGDLDEQRLRQLRATLDVTLRQRYHLFRYLHRGVAGAMASADLVVCRAGASVMAELPVLKLPAILVPYPHAGAHQDVNADFLVERGAAVKLADMELGQGALLPSVLNLLADRERLRTMAEAMGDLARLDAAENIATLVKSVARRRR